MSESEKRSEPSEAEEPYWWTPWAVLVGLVTYGLLGFLGVLSPKKEGPTAADVPVVAPVASGAPAPTPMQRPK